MSDVELRRVDPADLDAVTTLEVASYPSDEAASRETLARRIEVAPDCFAVAEQGGDLVGFVCGTRANGEHLTHASMAEHIPDGESLCIHSVVVAGDRRRQGLGKHLVAGYLEWVRGLPGLKRTLLICKSHLVEFYAANGFALVGPSEVVHGKDPWFEMVLNLE